MFNRLDNRRTNPTPLAWSSIASLAAMVVLNVFALSQQVQAAPRLAAPATIIEGTLA